MSKPRLLQAEVGDGKVYLVDCGRRRWLKNISCLERLGLRWPEDIERISSDDIQAIPLGPSMPLLQWDEHAPKLATMEDAREYLVSRAEGVGVEFGAAANPMPVPAGVSTRYADLFATPVLEEELYGGEEVFEYVPLDIQSSFDSMDGIRDNSLDFIIASHVIEHVRDPIGALILSMNKLKASGRLMLVVPKMERTLDRSRALTTLDHVRLDHNSPSRERDALHVVEFHAYAKPEPLKEVYEKSIQSINDDYHSMHYHVWNETNFREMLGYVSDTTKVFEVETFIDALKGDENYEFYVVIRKTQ